MFCSGTRLALLARFFSGCAVSRLAVIGHFVLPSFRTFFAGSKKALGERKSLFSCNALSAGRARTRAAHVCRTRTSWRVGCLPADGSLVPLPSRHAQNSRSTLLNARTGCACSAAWAFSNAQAIPSVPFGKGDGAWRGLLRSRGMHPAPCNFGDSCSELLRGVARDARRASSWRNASVRRAAFPAALLARLAASLARAFARVSGG